MGRHYNAAAAAGAGGVAESRVTTPTYILLLLLLSSSLYTCISVHDLLTTLRRDGLRVTDICRGVKVRPRVCHRLLPHGKIEKQNNDVDDNNILSTD